MASVFNLVLENIDWVFFAVVAVPIFIRVINIFRLFRKEGFVLKKEAENTLAIVSVILSIIAIFIFILGMFLPWYDVYLETGNAGTTLLHLDGSGAKIGIPNGQTQKVPANLNIVLLLIALYGVLDIVGMRSARKFGFGLLKSGISTLLILVAAYLFVSNLPTIINLVGEYYKIQVPQSSLEILGQISSSPIAGSAAQKIGPVEIKLLWSAGFGLYLFFISSVLKIIGGLVTIKFSKK